jgi:hypothetical protein
MSNATHNPTPEFDAQGCITKNARKKPFRGFSPDFAE